MTAPTAGDRVFLRKASGLIKSASNADVFIYDIGLVSIGLGLGFLLFYGPAVYLGGNLYVGTLIAGAAMLLVGLGMLTWTITIPRSGGIYNFGTRSMWPPLAFTLSFVEVTAWLFYGSFGAVYLVQLGIAPSVTAIGIIADKPGVESFGTDLAGRWGTFLIGSAALIIGAIILASGMRRFFFSQKVMFTIAVLGTLVFVGALIFTSRADFVSNWNSVMGDRLGVGDDAYNGVIQAAQQAGWSDPGFDWKQTLLFSNWAFLPLIGAAFSISIGGEIKQVGRGQTFGIIGAITISVLVWIISIALVYKTMGKDFLGAVTYSNLNGVEGAATPVTPFPTLLTGLGTDSVVLTILIALGFVGWIWLWIPTQILYPTRALVAWSLDRVAPDALGTVSERTHTPIPAILLCLAGGITFVAMLAFTSFFQLVIFIEVAVLAWALVLLAGVFFPYRRPDIYSKSPIANMKIAGFPVMSVACALGAVAAFFYFFNLFFDDFAAGHARHSMSVLIGWFVGSFVLYWIMWFIRRRQGVNVDLAFKEIPIE
jgi:basic amino acid/polyamine antiporter, APA family